jgi:IMP dehydrogenase
MARIIGKGYSFDDVLIPPKYNKILSRKDVNFRTRITRNYFLDIPLIAANMDTVCESKMAIALGKLGGLGVIHRFMTIKKQAEEVKKVKKENLIAAAAIGVKDVEERAEKLIQAGVNILVIDLAHGHSKYAGKTLDYLKGKYPSVDIMAGNVATKDAAEYFLSKGADAIKVGIGPGSMCTTRLMTGAGVPQITAIMDAYEATKGEIPICADGGIKNQQI